MADVVWSDAALHELTEFSNRGRPATNDMRELTGVPPYILRYRVIDGVVSIVRVCHGARRPTD